jgi:Fe2+ transport system protein FeoA
LRPGEGGTITATPVANERLAEIGLVKGEYVQLVKLAPFGDPVIIQVLDAPIIVRRADLAGVTVA